MRHACTINGRAVELEWTQETKRSFSTKLSKIGDSFDELLRDFQKPKKAEYAVAAVLWALLPTDEYKRHELPETLMADIDPETEAISVFEAVVACINDMFPDTEKKSTSMKSP